MKVQAIARRSGGWWAIEVPEVAGAFTQARRLDQIPDMVADAVATLEDIDPATVEVQVIPDVEQLNTMLAEFQEARSVLDHATSSVSAATRQIAAELVTHHQFTVRDAGALMGISAQRISQLLKSTEVTRATAEAAHKTTAGIRQVAADAHAAIPTSHLTAVTAVGEQVRASGLPSTLAAASAAARQAAIESTLFTAPRPPRPAAGHDTVTIAKTDYETLVQALQDAQDHIAVLEHKISPAGR